MKRRYMPFRRIDDKTIHGSEQQRMTFTELFTMNNSVKSFREVAHSPRRRNDSRRLGELSEDVPENLHFPHPFHECFP